MLERRRRTTSGGHSSADYNPARRAILQYGIDHVTHLFNGMVPGHHRTPGLVGAALGRVKLTYSQSGEIVDPTAVTADIQLPRIHGETPSLLTIQKN